MKIKKNIYFLDEAKFCFTVIKFCDTECEKLTKQLNDFASTHNNDKRFTAPIKSGRGRMKRCSGTQHYIRLAWRTRQAHKATRCRDEIGQVFKLGIWAEEI